VWRALALGLNDGEEPSNFLYVRYADDFVVVCSGTKAKAQEMKQELGGLLRNMGLTLSEEKTRLTHITEGFDFLGYRIIRRIGTNGTMVPKVLIPEEAIKRFQAKITGMLTPDTHNSSVNAKIIALNRVIRGWCQYYRNTSSPSDVFGALLVVSAKSEQLLG
jgi:RNA-directed DNA polymerase